jgi:D-sedoheptulose 7-phosphate isomerase
VALSFEKGGKVLAAGNGGSMADAMHFAEELTGRYRKDRRPLPAMSLNDPTHLSCVANDFGYEHVFSRLVEAFAGPTDTVLLLSTSGNSPNLLLAAEAARRKGSHVCGFLGKDGGKLLSYCDSFLLAPGDTSDRIQEIHMICLHIVVEAVEKLLELA